jgi:hypothetical protein
MFVGETRWRRLHIALLLLPTVLTPTSSAVNPEESALTQQDRALIPVLLRTDRTLKNFAIVARRPVSGQLDLVLALGTPNKKVQLTYGESYSWLTEDRLGIFLQDRNNANRIFTLTIESGPPCQIHLERVTARDVLISCPGDCDWGKGTNNQKFIFDVNAKRLVQHYAYPPFANYVLIQTAAGLYFVAGDLHHIIAAVWEAQANNFYLLPEALAQAILEKISIQTGSAGGGSYRVPALPSAQPIKFGPGKRFELVQNPLVGTPDNHPIIVEHRQSTAREFPLPQSNRQEWTVRRPDDARAIFPASTAQISEEIGPHQVEEDRLWFGKTFYNGEGDTGVGGFGYFDAGSLSYKLYAPAEIWKWSVSALLLEPDAAWLGLSHYDEGWGMSGGLLRWDRATQSVRHFNLKATSHQIVQWHDALYLATDEGIEVLHDNQVDRYIVDAAPNGKFQIASCDGGYR